MIFQDFWIFWPFLTILDFFWFFIDFWIFFGFFCFFFGFFGFFLDFLEFLDFFEFLDFLKFLDIFFFFWFFRIFWTPCKFTMVTTKSYQGYYWTPKNAKSWPKQHNKPLFCLKGKKSLGRRPKPSAGARNRDNSLKGIFNNQKFKRLCS